MSHELVMELLALFSLVYAAWIGLCVWADRDRAAPAELPADVAAAAATVEFPRIRAEVAGTIPAASGRHRAAHRRPVLLRGHR